MTEKSGQLMITAGHMTSYFGCVLALCGNWLCTLLPPVFLIINFNFKQYETRM